MDQHDLDAPASDLDALEEALVAITWLGEQQVTAELARFGLTVPQFYVLRILANSEQRLPVTHLARPLHLTPKTVTRVVAQLVALGLVARADDPRDRRLVRVALTEAGRARLAEAAPTRRQRLAEAVGHLPEADQRALLRLVGAFTTALGVRRPNEDSRGGG